MQTTAISHEQLEAIKELCNIGVGKGAAVLNAMLSTHISLNVPFIKIVSGKDFRQELRTFAKSTISAVELSFEGNISGAAQLLFPTETASSLVSILVEDEDDVDMDALRAGTFCEVGNIVLNGVMGSISNILGFSFEYSVPEYIETHSDDYMKDQGMQESSHVLLARTRFSIDELNIEGDIALFLQISAIHKLLDSIEEKF